MGNTNALKDPSTQVDPREVGHKPPHSDQEQIAPPGKTSEMSPKPDHGEESYKGLGRLKEKVALITGGDSGIGRAVAIAYAREGADLAISYLPQEEEDARDTERYIKEAGRKALLLPGDIRDEQHCRQLIDRTFEQFGKLDILINNAAFQMTHESIEEFSTEEFDRTFKTNVYAMFWLCKFASPRMKPGSVILNTASIQSYDPSPNLLAYATTKGAIVNFTKGLSKLLSKQGIRVNAVAPGPVWTPLIPSTMPDQKVENFGGDTSFERAAQPRELAPLYVFLGSTEANYVTGEVYGATGGQTPY
jgi:NAD(P)-dependent dehydrogenase (short-subunit alcohol dehydrogenase family)